MRTLTGVLVVACAACGGGGGDDDPVAADAQVATDAAVPPLPDAGLIDEDGSVPDAAGPDARQPVRALYAVVGTSLVTLDTTTGAHAVVGTLDHAVSRLAFDGATLHAIHPLPGGGFALATVDPCTAAVTVGATLAGPGGGTIHSVEGFAYVPGPGALYVAASLDAADFRSETLATADLATGALTVVGTVSGTADGDDLDDLTVRDGVLMGRDSPGATATHYYDIDHTTAAVTPLGVTEGEHVTNIAYDAATATLYAWAYEGTLPYHLVTVDQATGDLTDIGVTHASTELGGAAVAGFDFVDALCD